MNIKIAEEILDELLSSLEALETQSAAVLQFLKDKRGNERQLAPYMERASQASNVRWRAARLRMMSMLSSAMKEEEQPSPSPAQKTDAPKVTPHQPEKKPGGTPVEQQTKPKAVEQPRGVAEQTSQPNAAQPKPGEKNAA